MTAPPTFAEKQCMGEFKRSDVVLALQHNETRWGIFKILGFMPQAEMYRARRWLPDKGKWSGLQRLPPMHIAGAINPDRIDDIAIQCIGIANIRKAAVEAADREMRRMAFKILEGAKP